MSDQEVIFIDFVRSRKKVNTKRQLSILQKDPKQSRLARHNAWHSRENRGRMADFPVLQIAVNTMVSLHYLETNKEAESAELATQYKQNLDEMQEHFSTEQWQIAAALALSRINQPDDAA